MKSKHWPVSPVGLFAVLPFVVGLAVAAAGGPVAVSVRATAPITSNALDAARSSAIAKARRQCLEEILRARVRSAAEFQKHAAVLERAFLADPEPYLADFVVENHEIVDGGSNYAVKATATVRADALTLALLENGVTDLFRALSPPPTVMVLVKERFETRVTGTRAAEAALNKLLQQKELRVIEPEQKKLVELRDRVAAEAALDVTNAARAALGLPADFLILADAAITSSAPLAGTDLKARMANLTLWLVEAPSARVLATETAAASVKHIDELTGGNWALEEAVNRAGAALLARFESLLRDELLHGTEILVDLHGLSCAEQADAALAEIKKLPGVAAALQRFYYAGTAQLEVKCRAETAAFAGEVSKLSLDGQQLSVIEQLPRYLRVQRGAGSLLRTNTWELFRQFAIEKYKAFDREKARERNTELVRQVSALAADQRVNDQQRKELHAARKAVEAREQELFYRQQQLEQRERELAAYTQALDEARQALALQQQRMEGANQAAQAAAAAALRQAEERYAQATQAAYVAQQNYQSAVDGSSQSLAAAAHDIEHLIRIRDGTANLIGVALRGLIH